LINREVIHIQTIIQKTLVILVEFTYGSGTDRACTEYRDDFMEVQ